MRIGNMGIGKWMAGWLFAALLVAPGARAQDPGPSSSTAGNAPLSSEEVVRKLQEKNHERAEALRQFEGTRVYRMQYHGFPSDRQAEMVVHVNYSSPNKKEFTVISESGSKFIIDHVFKKLLEGEQEAANDENQRRTALSEENYDFQMDGYENTPSGPRYVLQVIPKSKNKFLYNGKIWVDAKDFAVTQIEAIPAKNPSFWIKRTNIEHRYEKVDEFWLPAENHTESLIKLGGRADLTIEYKDYKVLASGSLDRIPPAERDSTLAQVAGRN